MGENFDFSKAIEKVQEMLSDEQGQSQIENLLGMFAANQESSETPDLPKDNSLSLQNLPSSGDGLDFNTIMKIQKIIQAMNNQSDNTKTTFLNSLKPFFSKERREKLDQATKILKITAVLKALKNSEGGV